MDRPASITEKMIKTPGRAQEGFTEEVMLSRVLKDKKGFARWGKRGRLEGGVAPGTKSHQIISKWAEVQGVRGGPWRHRRMGFYKTQGTRTLNHAAVFRVLP